MKTITLLCAAGMSTSLLVNKMRKAAADLNYDCTINAYSLSESKRVVPESDIVLLGPQVRFNLKKLQAEYPGKPIECIEMRDYGTMNGQAVMQFAMKKLGD